MAETVCDSDLKEASMSELVEIEEVGILNAFTA